MVENVTQQAFSALQCRVFILTLLMLSTRLWSYEPATDTFWDEISVRCLLPDSSKWSSKSWLWYTKALLDEALVQKRRGRCTKLSNSLRLRKYSMLFFHCVHPYACRLRCAICRLNISADQTEHLNLIHRLADIDRISFLPFFVNCLGKACRRERVHDAGRTLPCVRWSGRM